MQFFTFLTVAVAASIDFTNIKKRADGELDTSFFRLGPGATKEDYFAANNEWATTLNQTTPQALLTSAKGQKPHTLLITCSDSRVMLAAFGVYPGEIFDHQNIANVITPGDINSQAVVQYAVENIKVKKVIVLGHTGCGGVAAALGQTPVGGVLDLWLNPVRLLRDSQYEEFCHLDDDHLAHKLSELNAIQSAQVLRTLPPVAKALAKGDLEVWAFLYDTTTGLMSDLEVPTSNHPEVYLLNGTATH